MEMNSENAPGTFSGAVLGSVYCISERIFVSVFSTLQATTSFSVPCKAYDVHTRTQSANSASYFGRNVPARPLCAPGHGSDSALVAHIGQPSPLLSMDPRGV